MVLSMTMFLATWRLALPACRADRLDARARIRRLNLARDPLPVFAHEDVECGVLEEAIDHSDPLRGRSRAVDGRAHFHRPPPSLSCSGAGARTWSHFGQRCGPLIGSCRA